MKKTLETGQDKIKQICDILKRETLEPARGEAESVIEEAKKRAEKIIQEAEAQAEKLLAVARKTIEQERNVFKSSLLQAAKQGVEALRQDIEHKLFNEELQAVLDTPLRSPAVIVDLIRAMVHALEKEGLNADLSAMIPAGVSVKEVNAMLVADVLDRLKGKSVIVGEFVGGAQLRLEGKKITLDMSDSVVKELLTTYLRKDFRHLIFAN